MSAAALRMAECVACGDRAAVLASASSWSAICREIAVKRTRISAIAASSWSCANTVSYSPYATGLGSLIPTRANSPRYQSTNCGDIGGSACSAHRTLAGVHPPPGRQPQTHALPIRNSPQKTVFPQRVGLGSDVVISGTGQVDQGSSVRPTVTLCDRPPCRQILPGPPMTQLAHGFRLAYRQTLCGRW